MKRRNVLVDSYKPKLEIGDRVMVHAYKYNGWLYRVWNFPIVVDIIKEWVVLCSYNCNVLSSEENSLRVFNNDINKINMWFLSPKQWCNVIVTIDKLGIKLYINMASPFIYEEGAIKYCDFDLDFKVFPNGSWTEIDINEYFENQVKYNYPPELVDIINSKEEKIKNLLVEQWFQKTFMDQNKLNKLYKKYFDLIMKEEYEYKKNK